MGKTPASFRARLRLAVRRLQQGRAGALLRDEGGASAVEFALLLGPFLLLFFGLFELGLVYLASVTLENAVIDTSREIRTGEVQTSGETANNFRLAVCGRMAFLEAPCATALRVDVRTVTTFASTSTLTTPNTPCWNPGGPASLVLVRAYYAWPVVTPLMQAVLSKSSDGSRTLTASTAFVNEPYNNTTATAVSCPS